MLLPRSRLCLVCCFMVSGDYPTEALSEPLFRTWFAVWNKIHGIG